MNNQDIIRSINSGGVGVLATDTLYGIVGKALDEAVVERIYQLKRRHPDKPFIILISDYDDLKLFGIEMNRKLLGELEKYWPGPVSIILPCMSEELSYLHRGTFSLAFRIPDKKSLRQILKSTGPLVAPSANPQGEDPARTISEAKKYFGDEVDFYQAGKVGSTPSKLIRITKGETEVLRG
jgi:L-threonylcarbamoyladenylate synthase